MSDIILYPHEILKTRVNRLSLENIKSEGFRRRISAMFAAMYRRDGVGLAAPQIGWNAAVFIGNPLGRSHHEQGAFVMVNPQVITWGACYEDVEGCLSLPGIFVPVKRWTGVHIRTLDLEGIEREKSMEGFPARIVQHENDHLMGLTFLDRLSPEVSANISGTLSHYLGKVEATRLAAKVKAEEAAIKKAEDDKKKKEKKHNDK